MTSEELESIKEEVSLLELANKILIDEVNVHVKEKHTLIKTLEDIKREYDSDFTLEELDELFEKSQRDESIYRLVSNSLKPFN